MDSLIHSALEHGRGRSLRMSRLAHSRRVKNRLRETLFGRGAEIILEIHVQHDAVQKRLPPGPLHIWRSLHG